jgi:hypothetical protein
LKSDAKRIRGQALAEFALVGPLFLILLFGMVEWRAAVQVDFATSDKAAIQRATEVQNSAGIGVPPAVVTVNSYDSPEPPLEVTGNHSFPIIVGGFFGWTGPGAGPSCQRPRHRCAESVIKSTGEPIG